MKTFAGSCLFLFCGLALLSSALSLPIPDPDNGGLQLPPGFHAVVVAEKLGAVRFVTVAPNGDIYLKKFKDGLVGLRDADGDGRAEIVQPFGSGPGSGIAWRPDGLYYSSNEGVYRYTLKPDVLVPEGEPEVVVKDLPNTTWQHPSKSFTFDDEGRLLVEVGAPANVYSENDRSLGAKGKDPTDFFKSYGGFWRFPALTLNLTPKEGTHFSTGHRHILALAWHPVSKSFFIVMNGREQLNTVAPQFYNDHDNAEVPAEEMHLLKEGSNFGWPSTYYDPVKKARMLAPEFGGDNQKKPEPNPYPDPLIAFPAHWAPMQMTIYTGTQFPEKYRNGAFVSFHGSWNRAPEPQRGYNVTFVPFEAKGHPQGSYEVFADGFAGKPEIKSPGEAKFRPCGVTMGPDGSLYVGADAGGRVWRIFYTGTESPTPQK
jgi:glucose/arabinose dehydrogenase